MRKFEGGASRDTDDNKSDPEGCFHPLVIREVSEYMKRHSYLPDGTRRPADNWQFGMPRAVWRKSLERHWLDVRLHDKGHGDKAREPMIDALCAVIFNAQGRLLEELLGRDMQLESKKRKRPSTTKPKLHADNCPTKWGCACRCNLRPERHKALQLNDDGTLTEGNVYSGIASGPIPAGEPVIIPPSEKVLDKAPIRRYTGTRRKK